MTQHKYQETAGGLSNDYKEKFGKSRKTLLILFQKLSECVQNMPLQLYFDTYFIGRCITYVITELLWNRNHKKINREQNTLLKSTKGMHKKSRGAIDITINDNSKISLMQKKCNLVSVAIFSVRSKYSQVL